MELFASMYISRQWFITYFNAAIEPYRKPM